MASERYRCTVVVPTFNRRSLLTQTLTHLMAQTLPRADFEVIVVDDGSDDGSDESVRAFADDLHLRYLWQDDQGFRVAAARNLGIRAACAPLIVFIDAGVIAHPNCLERHLVAYERDRRSAAIGYVHGIHSSLIECAAVPSMRSPSLETDRFHGIDAREAIYRSCDDDLSSLPAPWTLFWTCNVSAPTAMLRTVGGFDENFRSWGGEDVELAYRLQHVGLTLKLVRSARAAHLPHEFAREEMKRSALGNYRYFARKHNITIEQAIMGSVWRRNYVRT